MYVVIDKFDPFYPYIVSDPESGMPILFETIEEAEKEAGDCQDAFIVEL